MFSESKKRKENIYDTKTLDFLKDYFSTDINAMHCLHFE